MDHDTRKLRSPDSVFLGKCIFLYFFITYFVRTTSARARLQDEMGDIEMCGDSARGEMLLLRDTDQVPPEDVWVVRHRKME